MIYPLSNRIPESRTSSKAPQKRPISGTFGWHLKRGVWKKHWTSIKLQHGVNICKYAAPETRYIKIQTSQHLKSPKTYLKIQIFIFAPSDLGLRTMRQAIAALNLRTSGETRHPNANIGFEPSKTWLWTIQNVGLNKVWTIQKYPKIGCQPLQLGSLPS